MMLTPDQCPMHVYGIKFSYLFIQVASELFHGVDNTTCLTELLCGLKAVIYVNHPPPACHIIGSYKLQAFNILSPWATLLVLQCLAVSEYLKTTC